VTVSRGHGASPSERSNARLSVALRDRPGHAGSRLPRRGIDLEVYVAQDAYGLQRADIARVLFPWLYPMQTCRATPENQRLPDSASLRSFAGQRYLARCVAPRDLGLLNRVATVS
jgi:hypothetical protein